jgi:hypothetical protein
MLNGIIKGLRQMLADVEPAKELLEKDLNAAMEELRHHHELLKLVVDGAARLRLERDNARRRLCIVIGDQRSMYGEDVAKEYNWNCFSQEEDK